MASNLGTDGYAADCPVRSALEVVGQTWVAVTLQALRERPRRPVELATMIGGIRPKVLHETLRKLDRLRLVERATFAQSPPRVEYSLTPSGRTLLEAIDPLANWAEQHVDLFAPTPEP